MPYRKLPGGIGRLYVPPKRAQQPKKHPCKDCLFCQWCSDERCGLCKKRGCCRKGEKA